MLEECVTCGKTGAWHLDNPQTRHPFNDGSISASQVFGKRLASGDRTEPLAGLEEIPVSVSAAPWPFDPVLRQALVDKGVLTVEDLQNAEAKIRAISGQFGGQ